MQALLDIKATLSDFVGVDYNSGWTAASTPPCADPVWPFVACTGSAITTLNFTNANISGAASPQSL